MLIRDQTHLRFLSPDLTSEEQRILYVAVSRSMDQLFMNVPELDPSIEVRLSAIVEVQRVR